MLITETKVQKCYALVNWARGPTSVLPVRTGYMYMNTSKIIVIVTKMKSMFLIWFTVASVGQTLVSRKVSNNVKYMLHTLYYRSKSYNCYWMIKFNNFLKNLGVPTLDISYNMTGSWIVFLCGILSCVCCENTSCSLISSRYYRKQ